MESRVLLVGAGDEWQRLADAAFYYLCASVHPSSPSSTSIFGLAQWYNYHYYYGHVMWDIETFSIPALLMVQPEAAGGMLDYRFRCLGAARANAKLRGYRGIQFPWESSPSRGEEATPDPGEASWHEDHVTLSAALAFARYAEATGDEAFFRNQTWPVLRGVAEWIASRVEESARGFEWKRSMGIAERATPADNVAYTNMAARLVLREVFACAERLGRPYPPRWRAIEQRLIIPTDERGLILSHDGFRPQEDKGATPEPLAALFPLGYETDEAVEQATLQYYLTLAQDYIGSPMLSALYGVWAAWSGDRALSARLFEQGYAAFAADRFLQTLEYRPDKFPEQPKAGPFFANLSGFLAACLYGLPGLRISSDPPESWARRAVVLPASWDAIEVEQLYVRGRPATLSARHGDDRARLILR